VTEILLCRHGETDWNARGRWQGHAPTRLNETGRAQARALGARLAGTRLDAVYSSDLPRALETARIVAMGHGVNAILEPGLREIDVGSWQGLTAADLDGREWDGESYDAHRERVLASVRRIASRHAGGRVLAVTHGGSIRRLQEVILGEAPAVLDNCALWGIEVGDGAMTPLD
jgi:broad specificity phosphatase PhoE